MNNKASNLKKGEIEQGEVLANQKQWHPVIKLQIAKETPFIGPGCIQLLSFIEKSGSVRLASEEMQLSYSKAWKILNNLEKQTGMKILIRYHGGKNGGETFLTEEGKKLLTQFEGFEQECREAVNHIFEKYFMEGKQDESVL